MRIPIYGNRKLIAAFEFGLTISQNLSDNNVVVSREIIERAEKILVNELSTKSYKRFILDTIPNVLASAEPK